MQTVKIEVPLKYEKTFLFLSENYSIKEIKSRFDFNNKEYKLKKDLEEKYTSMDKEQGSVIEGEKELGVYFDNI